MRRSLSICISALLVFIISLPAFATPLLKIEYSELKRTLSPAEIGALDIAAQSSNSATVVGWPKDLALFSARGVSWTVLDDDLETTLLRRIADARTEMAAKSPDRERTLNYEYGIFASYDEILAWRDSALVHYPSIISTPDTLGYTYQGRAIWAIKISDNPNVDEDEPEIFLNGAIHAREVITPLTLINFADSLLINYGVDSELTQLVDEREIWILPVINIDGYRFNEEYIAGEGDPGNLGTLLWRKNRRPNGGGIYGVDLNRNFPFQWGFDDRGSSSNPESETYRGSAPASEPETEAIINFSNSHQFSGVINYHSFSDLLLYPWSHTDLAHPWDPIYATLSDSLNQGLYYTAQPASDLYSVNGDANDWHAAGGLPDGISYKTLSYVIEIGSGDEGGFWPATIADRDQQVNEQYPLIVKFCQLAATIVDDLGSALPPGTPVMNSPQLDGGNLTLSWHPVEGELGNVPVSYLLRSYQGIIQGDDVEGSVYHFWEGDKFSGGSILSENGSAVHYSGDQTNMASTLQPTLPFMVPAEGGTFNFMTSFNIETDWDFAFVQISTDGFNWEDLVGNITNEEGGITGLSGSQAEWVEALFPLDDYAGQEVMVRIRYVTDSSVNNGGIYVDNIGWVNGYSEVATLERTYSDTSYVISDFADTPGQPVFYSVRARDAEGDLSEWSKLVHQGEYSMSVEDAIAELPSRFEINSIYPNPFNPTTRVTVSLPRAASLEYEVINLLGQRVLHQVVGWKSEGNHSFVLDGSQLPSGLIFVRVIATDGSGYSVEGVRKAVLLK